MVWKRASDKHWLLYIDGERSGDIVYVVYNNGKKEYQGQAVNRRLRAISRVVKGQKITSVKKAVESMAKAQRK